MGSLAEMWQNQGIEKGMEKGMQKEKIIIARNMLDKGSDVGFISSVTGLPIKQIMMLKAKP